MTPKRFLFTLGLLALATVACAETTSDQALPAPIQALQERGIQIVDTFEAPGGLTGYAAIMGRRPVAVYLTQDGQHAILGTMIDSNGELANQATLQRLVAEPMSKRVWAQLENSTWVASGDPDAARVVYEFDDPNCPYCHVFWKNARPWVEAGKVQIRHVIVGIISESSPNKAATILAADHPGQIFANNQKLFEQGGVKPMADIPAEIRQQLAANLQLMEQLGFRGTPGIIYRDDQGNVQFTAGVPPAGVMAEILGPR